MRQSFWMVMTVTVGLFMQGQRAQAQYRPPACANLAGIAAVQSLNQQRQFKPTLTPVIPAPVLTPAPAIRLPQVPKLTPAQPAKPAWDRTPRARQ